MSALLSLSRSQLLVVDLQEKLVPAMTNSEALTQQIAKVARIADILSAPITFSEQYPKGLGRTLPDVLAAAATAPALAKVHFSCARDPALFARLSGLNRPQIAICGIESHVCVLQTAIDLHERGFETFVVADAVASRTSDSKAFALQRLSANGVAVITLEMLAFEWLGQAGTEQFKAVAPLLK